MASVVAFDPTEFAKVSNKTKEESEKDIEQYKDRVENMTKKADKLLAEFTSLQESGSEKKISGPSSNHK